jgi:hypothetical protein
MYKNPFRRNHWWTKLRLTNDWQYELHIRYPLVPRGPTRHRPTHPNPLHPPPPPPPPPQKTPPINPHNPHLRQLPLHAQMQQNLQVLLPHREILARRLRSRNDARSATAERSRNAQNQLRRRGALFVSEEAWVALSVLQGGAGVGERFDYYEWDQGDGEVVVGVWGVVDVMGVSCDSFDERTGEYFFP